MFDQFTADKLMRVDKVLVSSSTIVFPSMGNCLGLDAVDIAAIERFRFDIQRKGKIKAGKCTYLELYQASEPLIRLDVDGPTHDNPDGEEVPCPHVHIYREGDELRWAYPIDKAVFTDTANLGSTLTEFLRYCNVINKPTVQFTI